MGKKKLVFDVSKAIEPKSAQNSKRIFKNTPDDIITKLAECMADSYKNISSDLSIEDYKFEIKLLINGEYGLWNENASLYYEVDGVVAGAIFVATYEEKPLLVYLFTRSNYLGEGIASQLIQTSTYILKILKQEQLLLYIDVESDSETYNLYKVMGFK